MDNKERVKRPEPKFAHKDKLRHITGVEGYVHDIKTQMRVQHQNGTVETHNLPEPIYVVAYLDKNGCIQLFQTDEKYFEKV